jgi:hypothetical protein
VKYLGWLALAFLALVGFIAYNSYSLLKEMDAL